MPEAYESLKKKLLIKFLLSTEESKRLEDLIIKGERGPTSGNGLGVEWRQSESGLQGVEGEV